MKTLITGGAGFIGSHLAQRLVKDGHKVIAVDDMTAGKPENWNDIDCIKIIEDVTSKFGMNTIFSIHKPEVIFHNAASKKNICLEDPHRDLQVNGGGTLNLLELSREYGIKKFIHASTGSIYGERDITLIENLAPDPVSYYGVSKMAGEMYVSLFNKMGLDTTILRYFHVFGERQDYSQDKGGVIAIFIDKIKKGEKITIYGTGKQERSFTYVGDVVEANMLVWNGDTNGQIYNVASGIRIDIWYLLTILSGLLKMTIDHEMADRMEGDIDKFRISNSKIRGLGLKFTDVVDGLKKTI